MCQSGRPWRSGRHRVDDHGIDGFQSVGGESVQGIGQVRGSGQGTFLRDDPCAATINAPVSGTSTSLPAWASTIAFTPVEPGAFSGGVEQVIDLAFQRLREAASRLFSMTSWNASLRECSGRLGGTRRPRVAARTRCRRPLRCSRRTAGPWQVVVDHDIGALQVDTFTPSVRRHEYLEVAVEEPRIAGRRGRGGSLTPKDLRGVPGVQEHRVQPAGGVGEPVNTSNWPSLA